MKILAILKFAILFAEEPGEHLSSFHACAHNASGFVPVTAPFATAVSILLVTLDHFQADLIKYADKKLVDIVIDAHRHFDEFRTIGAGQAFSVYNVQSGNLW